MQFKLTRNAGMDLATDIFRQLAADPVADVVVTLPESPTINLSIDADLTPEESAEFEQIGRALFEAIEPGAGERATLVEPPSVEKS